MRYYFTMFSLLCVFIFSNLKVGSCQVDCPDCGVSHDACSVDLYATYPELGVAVFFVKLYTTCADGGDDETPKFWLYDYCTLSYYHARAYDYNVKYLCGFICAGWNDCFCTDEVCAG